MPSEELEHEGSKAHGGFPEMVYFRSRSVSLAFDPYYAKKMSVILKLSFMHNIFHFPLSLYRHGCYKEEINIFL